jgi:hypothetical protein
MRALLLKVAIFAAMTLSAQDLIAHSNFTGYSGAPGSRGTCSISCHNRSAFIPTITVTGFPAEYVPGQQYTVIIGHQGGSTIKQFNASVRIGTGSSNGGVISSGTGTAVYNVSPEETNGVHFSSSDQNSATFNWTAPASGTGQVRLYWAGLQGNLSNGADTLITLISNEIVTGLDDDPWLPQAATLSQNYPNPFNGETVIEFSVSEPGPATLEISNILGQRIYHWDENIPLAGQVRLRWNGTADTGGEVPSGVYFYQLQTAQGHWVKRMVLLR